MKLNSKNNIRGSDCKLRMFYMSLCKWEYQHIMFLRIDGCPHPSLVSYATGMLTIIYSLLIIRVNK